MTKADFKKQRIQSESWYDPEYDRKLVEQSIAKQYHILPSEQGELSYSDWALLVSGIMEDTPLGQVVLIRKENNREHIKKFSSYERKIYNEWRSFIAERKREDKDTSEKVILNFENTFRAMFGKG